MPAWLRAGENCSGGSKGLEICFQLEMLDRNAETVFNVH